MSIEEIKSAILSVMPRILPGLGYGRCIDYLETNGPYDPLEDGRQYVYFLYDKEMDAVKIGYSKHIFKRLSALRSSNSSSIDLIGWISGTRHKERTLQEHFCDVNIRGEWFEAGPVLEYLGDYIDNRYQGAEAIDADMDRLLVQQSIF